MSGIGATVIGREVGVVATAAKQLWDEALKHLFGQNNVLFYRTATQTFMLPP